MARSVMHALVQPANDAAAVTAAAAPKKTPKKTPTKVAKTRRKLTAV